MKALFLSDVFGRPGRQAVQRALPLLASEYAPDLVIANGENAAGGKGITAKAAAELFSSGVQIITSGNHIWKHRDVIPFIQHESRLLRPANYPRDDPGSGYVLFALPSGAKVGVLNLEGRIFMNSCLDDPFRTSLRVLEEISPHTRLILVDFHAEASSEKRALGWFLDGKVSAVLGTHTHIQTADEQILPGGTGYITDAGMTGPHESVIGIEPSSAIDHFLSQMPIQFRVAKNRCRIEGVLLDLDPQSGKCRSIERISRPV